MAKLSKHDYDSKDIIPEEMIPWYKFLYTMILGQRGITYDDLAEELGVSRSRAKGMLNSLGTWGNGVRQLHRLDVAISNITEKRGGVYATTGSTEAGREAFREIMEAVRMGSTDANGGEVEKLG